ncbi:hypothetical protein OUZ56_015117 [Daphnia magna]|uniref:Uncharacterized protein n=1 Tax=Daphnia magna TaxID=35525 RepID=A0ABR0AM37_9CRUS|nr:hypothetical protein OUZ56_015117 [Daphnia magna]
MLLPATPLTVVYYTATEANKYYVAPSYYTTAAPSYYTEPNYYTTTSSPLHSTLRPQNITRLQVTTLKPTPHTPSQTTTPMLHKTMLLPLIIQLRPGVLRYREGRTFFSRLSRRADVMLFATNLKEKAFCIKIGGNENRKTGGNEPAARDVQRYQIAQTFEN